MFINRLKTNLLAIVSRMVFQNRMRSLIKSMLNGDEKRFPVILNVLKTNALFAHSAPLLLGIASSETQSTYFLETLLSSGLDPALIRTLRMNPEFFLFILQLKAVKKNRCSFFCSMARIRMLQIRIR
ncbi:hypothetical protein [Leptospira sp. 'Mane']|uniref:hypothetical protein n=1 Tax=Leptospira sp. 'Mane' TaxID=3387407 RepID=UPI00398B7B8D